MKVTLEMKDGKHFVEAEVIDWVKLNQMYWNNLDYKVIYMGNMMVDSDESNAVFAVFTINEVGTIYAVCITE